MKKDKIQEIYESMLFEKSKAENARGSINIAMNYFSDTQKSLDKKKYKEAKLHWDTAMEWLEDAKKQMEQESEGKIKL